MKTKLLSILLFITAYCSSVEAYAQKPFEIRDGNFYRNGEAVQIRSGEMHFARIPHEYWRHRLKMVRALGLNTVATYVFWNFHEPERGQWDFSGDHDLATYIRIAAEEGLMVILRPGPYACAEWEYGGLPYWLQNESNMEVRRDNEAFLQCVKDYFAKLYEQVGNLQCTKGGPIVMVQCENEFGSYVSQCPEIPLAEHKSYMTKIKDIIREVGFDVPLFTSDGSWLFEGGNIEGALPTANGEGNVDNLQKAVNKYHDGKGPYMVAEFYTGWLDHWGETFQRRNHMGLMRSTERFLRAGVSLNFYMVHGGTNFGFYAGANYDNQRDIQPDLTSYDYDAPISEAGWRTEKYDSVQSAIRRVTGETFPPVPERIPVIVPEPVQFTLVANVLDLALRQEAVFAEQPLTFEDLHQPYGYVLYSHHFNQPFQGTLHVEGLRDYAVVYVNGEKVGVLNRNKNQYTLDVDIPFNATLQLLVENMGRINYGKEIANNKKGIISPVLVGDSEVSGEWEIYPLPMSEMPDLSNLSFATAADKADLKEKPMLLQGTFTLKHVGDTFLDMEPFGKGIVFVNGHHLGRYWEIGPQQTLYVPGCWLKEGKNTLVVFEQLGTHTPTSVSFTDTPVLMKQK